MDVHPHRALLAIGLFRLLQGHAIPFCAVGDTRQLPYFIPSDLDLIVSADDAARIPHLLFDMASANGAKLVQILHHEPQAWYFVLSGFAPDRRPWFLHPDFSCGYTERARPLLDAEELLEGRRLALDGNGGSKGFAVATPANEFIYYLLKKIEKQELNERQGSHLTAVYKEDPAGAVVQLSRFWSDTDVERIASAASGGDWTVLHDLLPELRRKLHIARPVPLSQWLGEVSRVIDRIRRSTGLWVVFLGCDGSGKSTILNEVSAELAPAFRRTRMIHLRAELRSGGRSSPVTEPHARPSHHPITSSAQLLLNIVRCWLGYWRQVRPALVRSTFVGFDRYHHDLLVDPRRYRYGGPAWLARISCRCVPAPDLWILLDAPASVILARKQEISSTEIERQLLCYRDLVTRLRGGHVVDASRPLDEVKETVEKIIIDFLAARVARRFVQSKTISEDSSSAEQLIYRGVFPPRTPLLALPSWRAPRILFAKSGGPSQRWRQTSLYPATRRTARLFRFALRAKAALGLGKVRLAAGNDWTLREFISDHLPATASVVLHAGHAGPSQKYTIELRDHAGTIIGYAKYAVQAVARRRLEQEHAMLKCLPAGVGPIPLKFGKFEDCTALLMTPLPGESPPAHLPPVPGVIELAKLLEVSPPLALTSHPYPRSLRERGGGWLDGPFEDLTRKRWPVNLQHGDFVPWNLRRCPGGTTLSAFDWEYGTTTGLPYIDLAFFILQLARLIYSWPPAKAAVYAATWLEQQQPFDLNQREARALVRLSMFDAYCRTEDDGFGDNHPMQPWRRMIWQGLW